jgi:hypothetical protein
MLSKNSDKIWAILDVAIRFFKFSVSLGGIDRFAKEAGEVFSAVRSAIYHEKYNENMVWNDLGILTLASPVELSKKLLLK